MGKKYNLIINEMLINLIEKYSSDKNYFNLLHKVYNSPELRKNDYYFFQDKINKFQLGRSLDLLHDFFLFQVIFKRDIYFPGIGNFTILPKKALENYKFPESFLEYIYIEKKSNLRAEKRAFTQSVITDDGKLDFNTFGEFKIQVKKEDDSGYTFKEAIKTKVAILNEKIFEHYFIKDITVKVNNNYSGNSSFGDIFEEYKKNKSYNIYNYTKNFKLDDIVFNIKILEDIIMCIGFIEANKEISNPDISEEKFIEILEK